MFDNKTRIEELERKVARLDDKALDDELQRLLARVNDKADKQKELNELKKRLDGIENYLGIEYNDSPVGYVEKVDE